MEIVLIFIPGHFIMQNDEKLRRGSWMHHRPVFLACHSQGCGSGSKHFLAPDPDPDIFWPQIRIQKSCWDTDQDLGCITGLCSWPVTIRVADPDPNIFGPGSGSKNCWIQIEGWSDENVDPNPL